MVTHFAPDDLAKWTKAWAANPGKSLVYLQYGPSIPAYLKLAGKAANGIVWATVTGVYNDPVGKIFRSAYKAKFNQSAGFSNSGSGYDGINMLARAWGATGDGQNFKANIAQLKKMIHRGVNGGYWLTKNAGLAYPAQTPDPGIGQAHLFFQIQNGVHHIIQPAPVHRGVVHEPAVDRRLTGSAQDDRARLRRRPQDIRGLRGPGRRRDDGRSQERSSVLPAPTGPARPPSSTCSRAACARTRARSRSASAAITSLATHSRARLGLGTHLPGAARSDLAERRRDAARGARRLQPARARPTRWRTRASSSASQAPDRALAGGLDTLERRKLLLACLLQRHTSVLLMDEPCSGLLADEIDEIDAVIRRIVEERGCAVIVVEHRLELLFAIAKRVVVLDAGSVIAAGPADEVFELPIVRKAYFEDDGSET